MTWIEDARGNKCSVEYFGSKENAQAALDGLKNCDNCINCSGCSGCSDCSYCLDRSYCSRCSRCSRCSYLKNSKPVGDQKLTVPKIEDLDQKVYAAASHPGALKMNDWHTCEKTHCRAGWIVALAGAEGKALEAFYNTELAAMLIYRESTGTRINPARFYDDNDDALADMKRCAGGRP